MKILNETKDSKLAVNKSKTVITFKTTAYLPVALKLSQQRIALGVQYFPSKLRIGRYPRETIIAITLAL